MLFRKTPTSERDNYVYRFNDGMVSVIAEVTAEEPDQQKDIPTESEVEAVMEQKNEFMTKTAEIRRCGEVLVVILEVLIEIFSGTDMGPVKIFCTTIKVIIIISSIILWVGTIIHERRKKNNKECEERVSKREKATR